MKGIKLNVGASPIWQRAGWYTIDHKVREGSDSSFIGSATNIPLSEGSCSTIFNSHMIEHIPHTDLESVFLEFNRVLEQDGLLRILSPDLSIIAKAYVNRDREFFNKALLEDENIRTDLGFGGMFLNFVVSPGQDTALFDRNLTKFIGGYAHLYLYDFEMLNILLTQCGFYKVKQKAFCESDLADYRIPLHVEGLEPVWQDFNQEFYKKNDLVHRYDPVIGGYNINFKVTGFDRDPLTSLIVEAKKERTLTPEEHALSYAGRKNYNRYGQSLMQSDRFKLKTEILRSASNVIDSSSVMKDRK
ncbi:MAG: methyltransferase domain-containing protein [Magnetococcus sp. YQC-5]